ncbi:MAG: hypothetical protein LBU64_06415 [Planctomycetota bacterium]|jgi:hypothetical protein|nr:hypothetical protein [Planctomycetota bacterium]
MAEKDKPAGAGTDPLFSGRPAAGGGRGRWRRAGYFLAGFVLALALARALWLPPPSPEGREGSGPGPEAAAGGISPAEREEFVQAVFRGDFPAMRNLGTRLFPSGADAGGAATALAEFETNGLPPNRVYSLCSRVERGKSFLVMLTLDPENRVVSFLAEESALVE